VSIELENLKWSDTGKRFDVLVEYSEGDGFFIPRKTISFRMYLVSNGDISNLEGDEKTLIDELIQARKSWRVLKTKFSHKVQHPSVEHDMTAYIYRNSYLES